jgi:hypothetical protein
MGGGAAASRDERQRGVGPRAVPTTTAPRARVQRALRCTAQGIAQPVAEVAPAQLALDALGQAGAPPSAAPAAPSGAARSLGCVSEAAAPRYSAAGKTVEEILADFERGELDSAFKGNTTDYLHAAIAVRASQDAVRIASATRFAAWVAAGAAVAAVVVAIVVAAIH